MLPIDWTQAIRYASLVGIAYSVNPDADYDAATVARIAAAGFKHLYTIYGNELATEIDPHLGKIVTFGFIAASDQGELVAVVRGTVSIMDWVHDASFLMLPCPIGTGSGMTEDGFTSVYRSLRIGREAGTPSVQSAIGTSLGQGGIKSVTITGHSLGGALAHLVGFDVARNTAFRDPQVYTFASPRVGDHLFAASYNSAVPHTYRIVNRQDLVPQLPPILPLPYEHPNTKYELNPPPGKMSGNIVCMHILSSYLWLMDQLAGTHTWPLGSACGPLPPPTEATFAGTVSPAVAH
jgi:hypothetical protein